MSFFVFAADQIGKLAISLGARTLGETIKDVRTARRMERLVQEGVDRIIEQAEEYLRSEKVSDARKEILTSAICATLQPLVDEPQRFFAGDLDGALIFNQCHPQGELPQEIREENLGQFYTVLFPQIAHFLSGSRIALGQWQAEGFREGFKRLSQLADEIGRINAKLVELPGTVVSALNDKLGADAERILHAVVQTLLNNLLFKLDLSPLRAERVLHGSLLEHFVIPAFSERVDSQRSTAPRTEKEDAILNALARPGSRSIVHGGAGLGKTTWCLWLQSRLLQADPGRIAVVLRLREVTDIEKRSLLELLRDRVGTHLRDALSDNVLRQWYSTGRLVVILDGFDEVAEERRDAVETWIRDLGVVAENCAVLVTSRPLQSGHLEAIGSPWKNWDLLPFDMPRIVEFIERWHRYLPEGELSAAERRVDPAALAQTFFNDPSLKPLADTPLMLGTLLFVHHRDKELPSGRVDLYERYLAAMLGLRDSGLGIQARATKLTDKEKRRVLAHIALHFHRNSVNEVNDQAMRQLVIGALAHFNLSEDVDRLLPALCERTGLLQGPGAWSFMHKTIGEFLVAELVCEGTTRLPDGRRLDRKELWEHRHEDAWNAVLFFWAGKASPRELEEFVSDLVEERSERGTVLALALLHDQGEQLTREIQQDLARQVIHGPWPNTLDGVEGVYTPRVPRFAFAKFVVNSITLRGLSQADSGTALEDLLRRKVLVPGDISMCSAHLREPLTMAILQAFQVSQMHEVRLALRHKSSRDIALHTFFTMGYRRNKSSSVVSDFLVEWADVFPEARAWLPLLLLSLIHESRMSRLLLGPQILKWHGEPIAQDWLRESNNCKPTLHADRPESAIDILSNAYDALSESEAASWNITPEQHAELLAWCRRLMIQREELRAVDQNEAQTQQSTGFEVSDLGLEVPDEDLEIIDLDPLPGNMSSSPFDSSN